MKGSLAGGKALSLTLGKSLCLRDLDSHKMDVLPVEDGRNGLSFIHSSVMGKDQMIDLNCRAAVDMCLTALPYMSRGSELINICSVAGFQPLTGLNTYAATKAFLLSWTKALHHELLLKGIKVTARCPYWVKDTEFIPVAKETDYAPIAKEGEQSAIRNFWFAGHAKYIVRQALRASRLNLWVCSPGPVAKTERLVSWVLPDFIVVPAWDILRRL